MLTDSMLMVKDTTQNFRISTLGAVPVDVIHRTGVNLTHKYHSGHALQNSQVGQVSIKVTTL